MFPAVPMPFIQISELRYTMDGHHTGQLLLMHDDLGCRHLVAWRSAATGLQTPWHGVWYPCIAAVGLHIEFDCKNRPGKKNFTKLYGEGPHYVGVDQAGRDIKAMLLRTWTVDPNSMGFLLNTNDD